MAEYISQNCHNCGNLYKRIGSHWAQSSCNYPKVSSEIDEIISGLLMGDGCLTNRNGNPYLICQCVEEKYLEYLHHKFGELSSAPPKLHITGSELLERNGDHFNINEGSEYQDQYRWQTRANPNLKRYCDWYKEGEKVWPDNIDLTPTTLKHWYCGDGNYNNIGTNDYISIGVNNERGNKEKINNMFKKAGLPEPNRWNVSDKKVEIVWNKVESMDLINYMGEPIDGYEYKWGKK